jgi:phosphonate degradation associated HDIG domain protein
MARSESLQGERLERDAHTDRPGPDVLVSTMTNLDRLLSALAARGHVRYDGEVVSHLEHALQCATLAERAGAGDALVAAALFHDIGHLLSGHANSPWARGTDDQHEVLGADVLEAVFGPTAAEPVRWHVAAKRCLAADGVYCRLLSEASRGSLQLQGGAMDGAESALFLAQPYAADAIRLRRWDDAAKRARLRTAGLDHFTVILARVAQAEARRHPLC